MGNNSPSYESWQWNICAFTTKRKAQKYVELANKEAKLLKYARRVGFTDIWGTDIRNKYDLTNGNPCVDVCYSVEELELK
jgi:hypothetical protein